MPVAGCPVSFLPLKILFSCLCADQWEADYIWTRKEAKTL